jgi:hypothetical protein
MAVTYGSNINGSTAGIKGLIKKAVIVNVFRRITLSVS